MKVQKSLLALLLCCMFMPSFGSPNTDAEAAAEELLVAMEMDTLLEDSITQMLSMQVKQNPAMADYQDVMAKFLNKHMSFESLKTDLISLYAQEFSASEIKEITAFYKTPVGQKAVKKMPQMMARGAQIGSARVAQNQAELMAMMAARSKELEEQTSQK